jgi:hypothetical protein
MAFMSSKMIKYVALVFALTWFSLDVHAAYYVVLRRTDPEEGLRKLAHAVYRQGVPVSRSPHSYSANMAFNIFSWFLHDRGSELLPVFFNVSDAERQMRRAGIEDGLVLEISPDERAFNLRQTIRNLMAVVPNQGGERTQIARMLGSLFNDYAEDDLLAGIPLSTDQTPVNPVIRGENIWRIYIYTRGVQRQQVERDPQDGPFIPGSAEHAAEGYPFDPPTASSPLFPVAGPVVSVVVPPNRRPTDNLTSLASCSAVPDRQAQARSHSQTGCEWEMITTQEFNARHARHLGIVPALLLLQ